MHRDTANAAVLLTAVLLTSSCADVGGAGNAPPAVTTPAAPTDLESTWSRKLEDASVGAVAACRAPGTTGCAQHVRDIMIVVADLEAAIRRRGPDRYPKTLEEIKKMRAAEHEYLINGCEGAPTASDPGSPCSAIAAVAEGAGTLTFTLNADEA